MGLFDQIKEEATTSRWEAERIRLENNAADAVNALGDHIRRGSLMVPSRVGNGQMLVVGTEQDILLLLGIERVEGKVGEGEVLYRKRPHD